MRLKDYACKTCDETRKDVFIPSGSTAAVLCHAGHGMVELPGAPMVAYKPHYSHALGRHVERYADEDKELGKKGQWIASKAEANSSYGTDIFKDNVAIKPASEEKIKKHVEKAAAKLAADGRISFRY